MVEIAYLTSWNQITC